MTAFEATLLKSSNGSPSILMMQIITAMTANRPVNPKPGCRFAARCEYATEACSGADPALRDLGGGHFCACTLEHVKAVQS